MPLSSHQGEITAYGTGKACTQWGAETSSTLSDMSQMKWLRPFIPPSTWLKPDQLLRPAPWICFFGTTVEEAWFLAGFADMKELELSLVIYLPCGACQRSPAANAGTSERRAAEPRDEETKVWCRSEWAPASSPAGTSSLCSYVSQQIPFLPASPPHSLSLSLSLLFILLKLFDLGSVPLKEYDYAILFFQETLMRRLFPRATWELRF